MAKSKDDICFTNARQALKDLQKAILAFPADTDQDKIVDLYSEIGKIFALVTSISGQETTIESRGVDNDMLEITRDEEEAWEGIEDTVQYGGAIFSRICKCGETCKMPKNISVNEFVNHDRKDREKVIPAICPNCGKVDQPFVRWAKE